MPRTRPAWLIAAIAAAGAGSVLPLARRISRLEATAQELSRPLPGDHEVPDPLIASTRAVAIRAPACVVWPWLVQMGWRRAGWYSYNRIDNDKIPSAERIIPELQHLQQGDFVPEGAGVGWTVKLLEPGHLLLLTSHGPMSGIAWVQRRDSSWLFQVDDAGAGRCRLLERQRTSVAANQETAAGKLMSTPPGSAALAIGLVHRRLCDGPPSHARDQTPRRSPAASRSCLTFHDLEAGDQRLCSGCRDPRSK